MQNKKLEEDLGAKVSNEEYQKAVIASWGEADISDMKKNDYAYVEKNISLNNGPMNKIYGKGMTITNVDDAGDYNDYHLVIQSEETSDGTQNKMSTRERVLSVKKANAPEQQSVKVQEKSIREQNEGVSQLDAEDEIQSTPFENFAGLIKMCSYANFECFRLVVEKFEEDVPLEIKDKNCRHFANCKWSGKKVSFVVRVTPSGGETETNKAQINKISFKIVNDISFLFRMVDYCFEGISEYKGQKFPVKICQTLKDTIK